MRWRAGVGRVILLEMQDWALEPEEETATGLHVQVEQRTKENEKVSGPIPRKDQTPDRS